MQLGLQLPNFTLSGGPSKLAANLAQAARWAEDIGFESVWVMDHFFQIPPVGPAEMDMLEGYSTLSYLAAVTQRVRLGTLVTGVTYRYPGILVKTATTLDVLSGGRAWFGVGAAWFDREHAGLGVPYPPLGERFERMEEMIQIALQMWSDNNGAFKGKHYQLQETLCVPQPLSKPHPPIMIGGMGEQKTLRMVAQYAQACNLFQFAGLDAVRQKLDVLQEHCRRLGRDYNEIQRTTLGSFDPAKRKQFVSELAELAKIGIDTAIMNVTDPTDRKVFDALAEVAKEAAKFEVKGR